MGNYFWKRCPLFVIFRGAERPHAALMRPESSECCVLPGGLEGLRDARCALLATSRSLGPERGSRALCWYKPGLDESWLNTVLSRHRLVSGARELLRLPCCPRRSQHPVDGAPSRSVLPISPGLEQEKEEIQMERCCC